MNLSEALYRMAPDFFLTENDSSDIEQEVIGKLDRSTKMDEIDTVTFGLETDDGKIIKVYVNAEQAEDFEKDLSTKLGEIDDIEEVLNDLAKDYEIVDVEWPNEGDESEAEGDEEVDDGGSAMNQEVYNNPKEKKMAADLDNNKLEGLNVGEKLSVSLLEDGSFESRLTTPTQLMVYHAILELGIPEVALQRSAYRAAIIKGIKNKALEITKNPAEKTALKLFIKRTDDYDAKALSNAQGDQKDESKSTAIKGHVISEDKCEWSFDSDGDILTVACQNLNVSLGAEETEKLVKGISNKDAVVVRDDEDNKKKYVFSPRGSSVLVKQVGTNDGYMMTSKDVDSLFNSIAPEKAKKEEEEVEEVTEGLDPNKCVVDNFTAWIGKPLKTGRNMIDGAPVDINSDTDGTYLDMTAVDRDACTHLLKKLRAAGFKAKRDGETGISINA